MNRYEYLIKHPEVFFKNEKDQTYFTEAEILLGLEPTFSKPNFNKDEIVDKLIFRTPDDYEFKEELIDRMLVYIIYHDILLKEKIKGSYENEIDNIKEEAKSTVQNNCDHHWGYKDWVDSCYYKCKCTKCGKVEYFYERD